MARLSISFLGSFQVTLDGAVCNFRTDKIRAFLAYLAVESAQPHRREALATLLWPDSSDDDARNNLRQALYQLRQTIADQDAEPPFLYISPQDIQFNVSSQHWLDTTAFTSLLVPCPVHDPRQMDVCQFCARRLEEAVDLYRGDFLSGFNLPDSEGFDDWARGKQMQFHHAALDTLRRLGAWFEQRREYDKAARYARRELELEPWEEEAHRRLMRVLALDGQSGAALRQYEICRTVLRDSIDVEPSDETTELYEQILAGTIGPLATTSNPYKGLHFFDRADAVDFYGREGFAEHLLATIHRQPLCALIGPSGSGKSSVIFAGLLPRLAQPPAPGSDARWEVVDFRPGDRPFANLAAALCPLLDDAGGPAVRQAATEKLAQDLASGRLTLAEVAGRLLERRPNADRLLLVIDQFEEVYTLCTSLDGSAQSCRRFVDLLLDCYESASPVVLLLGLRSDFLGQALAYRRFANALEGGTLLLAPMSQPEMVRAIEEPARSHGITFEAGLVARLLDDVGSEPGSLPLLEFALTELWRHHMSGTLTHAAYDDIGGVQGALAAYAEQVYADFSSAEQEQARRVFLQLVRPGQRTGDTRRQASRAELGENGWHMAQQLADARLAVTTRNAAGRETVEIVHEALISGWGRLRAWLEGDRAFRLWQERLRNARAQWEASGHDEGALLRGALLSEAEQWIATRSMDLDAAAHAYVFASLTARQHEMLAAETERQRALEQAQALAQTEVRARHRLHHYAIGLAFLVLLAAAAAFVAFRNQQVATHYALSALSAQATAVAERNATEIERQRAEAERNRADSERQRAENQAHQALFHQLAAQSSAMLGRQTDLALLLSLEALRTATSSEDRADLLLNLRLSPRLVTFLHNEDAVYSLAYRPDGQDLVTVSAKAVVRQWDSKSFQPADALPGFSLPDHSGISINSRAGLVALAYGTVITVYNVSTGRPLGPPLVEPGADVQNMAFPADGSNLVVGDRDGNVFRMSVPSGITARLPITSDASAAWALSPDGRRLAMTVDPADSEYTAIAVKDLDSGELVGPILHGHRVNDGVHSLVFSPDGRTLASASFDRTIILWDVESGQPLYAPLVGHTARALVAAFSPDGRTLATGGADDNVILWDVATGQRLGAPMAGHSGWVRSLAFSPDGRTLASGGDDGDVILWDITTGRYLGGHTARAQGVVFADGGRTVIAGGLDTLLIAWDTGTGQPLGEPLTGDEHAFMRMAISPDRRTFASTHGAGNAILWDAATRRPLSPLLAGHTDGAAVAVAFSPDGHMLATGGFDKTIRLWDTGTHRPIGPPLTRHSGWVLALAFSPDGKMLASGSSDNTVMLWDLATRQPVGPALTGHSNWVDSLAFSPDGAVLASGSSDNTVILWDPKTGRRAGPPLTGHTAPVWYVMFDPNDGGRTLVTGGGDGTVIRWDVSTHEPLGPPMLAGVETETVALSPDGSQVAVAGFDNDVSLWNLDRRSWQQRVCTIANRNLTADEWQRYMHDVPYRKICPDLPAGNPAEQVLIR